MIAREAEGVYYATLLARRARAEEFLSCYAAAEPEELAKIRAEFRHRRRGRMEPGTRSPCRTADAGSTVPRAFRGGSSPTSVTRPRSRRGRATSAAPLKAALDVLRGVRNEVRLIVDHGGLTADSHRRELCGRYTPFNAFVSIGPPPLPGRTAGRARRGGRGASARPLEPGSNRPRRRKRSWRVPPESATPRSGRPR
ncbi:hypothetical protein ACRAWF_06755 [Streptomyces sp. L7]